MNKVAVDFVIPVLAMAHGWLWFRSETSKSGLSHRTAGPCFQLSLGYFHLTLLANTLSQMSSPSFPQFTLQLSSSLTSSPVFQMARVTLGAFGITEFYFFSTSSLALDQYLYCYHSLAFLLTHWVCLSYVWVSVNVLKHYFVLTIFFSEFSSDLLCVMNQIQILYLGIPRLSLSL